MIAGREHAAAAIRRWFDAALAVVEPEAAVARVLAGDDGRLSIGTQPLNLNSRLVVVGAGKAATAMARGTERVLGERIQSGLVVTKDGHRGERPPERIDVVEAAHPIPDERGLRAGDRVLELVAGLSPDDTVIALISGGGSALLESLRPPVNLRDLQVLTEILLRAGAPIQHLNVVRTPLSRIKGGGLRDACGSATVVTLVLSDVLGNNPRVIASGPTIRGAPLASRANEAVALLERYEITERVPRAILECLTSLAESDSLADEAIPAHDAYVIIGDLDHAMWATQIAAEAEGLTVERPDDWRAREGEARLLAREWVARLDDVPDNVDVVIGGGEATVTVAGAGEGGRNTEFALAAALELTERRINGWLVASLATDGDDAGTGAAGAIAGGDTVRRATAAHVDSRDALARNDSVAVFQAAGGLVITGPTETNVNDMYFAVRVGEDNMS